MAKAAPLTRADRAGSLDIALRLGGGTNHLQAIGIASRESPDIAAIAARHLRFE